MQELAQLLFHQHHACLSGGYAGLRIEFPMEDYTACIRFGFLGKILFFNRICFSHIVKSGKRVFDFLRNILCKRDGVGSLMELSFSGYRQEIFYFRKEQLP